MFYADISKRGSESLRHKDLEVDLQPFHPQQSLQVTSADGQAKSTWRCTEVSVLEERKVLGFPPPLMWLRNVRCL